MEKKKTFRPDIGHKRLDIGHKMPNYHRTKASGICKIRAPIWDLFPPSAPLYSSMSSAHNVSTLGTPCIVCRMRVNVHTKQICTDHRMRGMANEWMVRGVITSIKCLGK